MPNFFKKLNRFFASLRMTVGDQKGIIHLIPLFLLLAGIIAGVYLVQKEGFQLFKPKASANVIEWQVPQPPGSDPDNCITGVNPDNNDDTDDATAVCSKLKLKFNLPDPSSDAGSNMSFVKTVYAQSRVANARCSDDKKSITSLRTKEKAQDCPENSLCKEEYINSVYVSQCIKAASAPKPADKAPASLGGPGWSCESNSRLKKDKSLWFLYWPDEHKDCPAKDCKPTEDKKGATCSANAEAKPAAGSGEPSSISPNGDVSVSEGDPVNFYWNGPANAKKYRLIIRSDDDKRGGVLQIDCPKDFSGYFLCTQEPSHQDLSAFGQEGEGGAIGIHSSNFQDGATYEWWVDALDEKGATIVTINSGFQFKISKTGESRAGAAPVAPAGPSAAVVPTVECQDDPPGAAKPEGYKWEADCYRSCSSDDNCEPNKSDPRVNAEDSNWCYGFIGGSKCMVLKYTGNQGGPAGSQTVKTCKNETKTWDQLDGELKGAGYDQAFDHSQTELEAYNRAACPSAADTAAPTASGKIAYYRWAISYPVPQNVDWENITTEAIKINTVDANPGVQSIFFEFADSNKQVVKINNLARQIAYIQFVAPDATTATPTPTQAPAAPVQLSADLAVSPRTVQKKADGTYPKIQIRVSRANKAWTLYYQNTEGSNCGGTCNVSSNWTAFSSLSGVEGGGSGGVGDAVASWTPVAYISGVHTIALIDTDTSTIIKKDITFRDNTQTGSIPAGSACSAYETTTVCGGTNKTYDKCTDNLGQSGSALCSSGATQFYCVGSTNSNCDSRYNAARNKVVAGTYQYSCSVCPNLTDGSSSRSEE